MSNSRIYVSLSIFLHHTKERVCGLMHRRTVKPRFWLLLMSALVVVFCCVYVSQGHYIEAQAARVAELEARRDDMLEQNAVLDRKIAFAKTDEYVERVARDQMGLLKEGEVRFVTGQ